MSDKAAAQQEKLEALLKEARSFPPSGEFKRQANVSDPEIYDTARRDLEGFWAEEAKRLDWFEP
jgi:acetyl-CoA synthetase